MGVDTIVFGQSHYDRLCSVTAILLDLQFPCFDTSYIIDFHMVCSLRVAKMLCLGISSVLVCNVFAFAFYHFLYHCLLPSLLLA